MKTKRSIGRLAKTATVLMLAFGLALSGATITRAEGPHDRDQKNNRKHGTVSRAEGPHDRDQQNHWKRTSRAKGPQHFRREMVVKQLPRGHRVIRAGRQDYYIHSGHFYRKDPRGFVSISTPVGALVASLPGGFVSVSIGGVNYWQVDGVYFRRAARGFVVVTPPVVHPALPLEPAPVPVGAESVAVDVPLLNVRSGPGLQFPIVGVVSQGQLLDIHGDAPGWYYVQGPSGSFGWVIDNLTRPVPAG
jgi:hypothetical protein